MSVLRLNMYSYGERETIEFNSKLGKQIFLNQLKCIDEKFGIDPVYGKRRIRWETLSDGCS